MDLELECDGVAADRSTPLCPRPDGDLRPWTNFWSEETSHLVWKDRCSSSWRPHSDFFHGDTSWSWEEAVASRLRISRLVSTALVGVNRPVRVRVQSQSLLLAPSGERGVAGVWKGRGQAFGHPAGHCPHARTLCSHGKHPHSTQAPCPSGREFLKHFRVASL